MIILTRHTGYHHCCHGNSYIWMVLFLQLGSLSVNVDVSVYVGVSVDKKVTKCWNYDWVQTPTSKQTQSVRIPVMQPYALNYLNHLFNYRKFNFMIFGFLSNSSLSPKFILGVDFVFPPSQ